MIIVKEISDVRKHRKIHPEKSWGFVPTMGFLHDGHMSLVKKALEENDACAVSIYVNVTQFNNPEDFQKYPKDMDRDLSLLKDAGVDLVFTPDQSIMYPDGFASKVTMKGISEVLEGACRPGHFDGVTTVVSKLFNIVQPDRAYFGKKDAQQLIIIQKMVKDLDFDIQVIACDTSREENGLAMSSRNARLSDEQRSKAKVIHESLQLAEKMIISGEKNPESVTKAVEEHINGEPLAKIDMIAISDASTLQDIEEIKSDTLISLGVFFGDVRLIDAATISLG